MALKTTTTKIQLKGLDHFALNVKDMKRSKIFISKYWDFLSFTEPKPRQACNISRWMQEMLQSLFLNPPSWI